MRHFNVKKEISWYLENYDINCLNKYGENILFYQDKLEVVEYLISIMSFENIELYINEYNFKYTECYNCVKKLYEYKQLEQELLDITNNKVETKKKTSKI